MPAIIVHGLIGYILYDKIGLIYGLLPDLIGFGYYFLRLFMDYKFNKNDSLLKIISPNKMNTLDWKLYDISHSLIPWLILLYLLKDKAIYAAIIAIIMDIFLHSSTNGWRGPTFLYPISNYVYDGISWNKPVGILITGVITLLIYVYRNDIIKILDGVFDSNLNDSNLNDSNLNDSNLNDDVDTI